MDSAYEVGLKKIPSLSIALVDDQRVVFAASVGYADPTTKALATPDTPYRVGSVSKPFTAILLMMLVEMGLIDLDAPIQDYLPEFEPKNKYGKKITLRQMLSHRSGVVREGPVGNYFDDTHPTLEATVKSLNKTELVYEPGSTTSYSNMALATVGYVIERTQKEPFDKFMQRKLLDPLGMKNSTFLPSAEYRKLIPKATMWTYHGREFAAPTMEMGMAPAGNLYSSVNDQRSSQFLFAGGKGVLKKKRSNRCTRFNFQEGEKTDLAWASSWAIFSARVIGHGARSTIATEFAALRTTSRRMRVERCRNGDDACGHDVAAIFACQEGGQGADKA